MGRVVHQDEVPHCSPSWHDDVNRQGSFTCLPVTANGSLFDTAARLLKSSKMGRRDRLISTSILRAIFRSDPSQNDGEARLGLVARIWAFFALFSLSLARYRAAIFRKLRTKTWEMEEEEYTESFRSPSKSERTDLVSVGDLGYSGSVNQVPWSRRIHG